MSVSIVIAEDHALFRSGLKQLLLLGEGLEVIGEAGDGFEAVNMTVASRPDLLLLDLSMPDRDGLEVIAHVRKECPDTRILIISMHATSMHIRAAFKAGAHGYLLKTANHQEFLFAIQCVLRGNRYVSTELTGTMIDWCVGEQTEEIASPFQSRAVVGEYGSNRGGPALCWPDKGGRGGKRRALPREIMESQPGRTQCPF